MKRHRLRAAFSALLVLIAALGCDSRLVIPPGATDVPVLGPDGPAPRQISPFGLPARERIVIRTQEEWVAIWPKIQWPPLTSPPDVDFTSNVVIVASMGSRNSGGFSIRLDRAAVMNSRLYLEIREVSPGPNCVVTEAITYPAVVARIPLRPDDVSLVESTETLTCGGS